MMKFPTQLGTVQTVLKRYDKARERKERWRDLYSEAYEYTLPRKETFNTHSQGTHRERQIYDSTAVVALQRFSSRLQATLTPPWRKWTTLKPGPELSKEEREDQNVQEALDDAMDIFFSHLNHSNFITQAPESYLDLGIGTGALLFNEGEGDSLFNFHSVPLSELVLEEGAHETVETVFREFKVPVRNIPQMYKKADLSQTSQNKLKDSPDTKVCIVEGTIWHPESKKYYAVAIEKNAKHLVWTREYDVSPWIVFRWATTPGEIYGRGPVINLLSDIKTANKMMEFKLRSDALTVGGIYTAVSDGVINPYTIRMAPNTIIPVLSNSTQNPSLRLLERQTGPTIVDIDLESLRERIRQGLFNRVRTPEDSVVSATQIALENQELVEDTGASFGRLQTELLEKIVKRGVDILRKNGKFPDIPVDGRLVTLRHTSPLARAQDEEEIVAINNYMALVASQGPEAQLLNLDVEMIGKVLGPRMNIPVELIPNDERKQELKNNLAAAQQAEMGAQNEPSV